MFARVVIGAVVVACACATTMLACSSFDDADTPEADASVDSERADASAGDATGDAAGDTTAVPDADAGCPNGYALVESFSTALGLAPGWATNEQNGKAVLAANGPDGAVAPSAASALFATVTLPAVNGAQGYAYVARSIPFIASSFTLKYSLRVGASTAFAEIGCRVIVESGAVDTAFFSAFMGITSFNVRSIQVDGSEDDHELNALPTMDWVRVELSASKPSATEVTANVVFSTLKGVLLDDVSLAPIKMASAVSSIGIQCGVAYTDYGADMARNTVEVMVDDLELRACR